MPHALAALVGAHPHFCKLAKSGSSQLATVLFDKVMMLHWQLSI